MLPFLLQFFLHGFVLDAIFSFWAEFYHLDSGFFAQIRGDLASLVFLLGSGLYLAQAWNRRISLRLIGLPALFLLWATAGAFPLPLFYLPNLGLLLSGAQLLYAAFLIARFWRPNGFHEKAGFINPAEARAAFSGKHFLLFAAANLLLIPLLAIAFLGSSVILELEKRSAGFVRIRPSGIYISRASFQKDGREVALDGMMHIADASFYQQAWWSANGPRTLVLLEGVTDHERRLPNGLGMNRLAGTLGLSSQMEKGYYHDAITRMTAGGAPSAEAAEQTVALEANVDVRRADLDVSSFRPQTLLYLKTLGRIFEKGSWPEMLAEFRQQNATLSDEQTLTGMMEDILDHRNTHLIGEMQAGLTTYPRIVIPWGALHLAAIQAWLLDAGFQEVSREEKPAVLFWKKRSASEVRS